MIKIAFVVPWDIDSQAKTVLSRYDSPEKIVCQTHLATLAGVEKFIPDASCDAVIARGYNYEVLEEKQFDCPVIRLKFTSIEVINGIFECKRKFGAQKIAVIGPIDFSISMDNLVKIGRTPIAIYRQHSPYVAEEAVELVRKAVSEGCDAIVGGGTAHKAAVAMGIPAHFMISDDESVWEAVDTAVKSVIIRRHKQEMQEMLQTAFDLSKEGALFIDDKGIVRLRNDFACRILGPQKTAAGDKLTDMLPEIKHLYAQSRKAPGIIENELFSRDGKSYSASFVPVPVKGRRDGTLFIFRDIGIIQDMEAQIRRKIHAKGMVTKYSFSHIISNDPRMAAIIGRAGKFAAVDSNVLIEGETGTGKELFAQSIHNASPRSRRPFVAINCAALPEHLLESELFGYSGGAFTGASPDGKKGLFELAHNGTLFLDEVSELPVTLQVKLLRAIEEKEIRRIGDDRIFPVNVRVIAATNKNLRSLCENGGFREDLFFRLNVLSLSIPPLRERPGDILTLFHKFLSEYAAKFEKTFPAMDSTCRTLLLSHSWRGNVREVRNIAERVMALYEQTDQDASGIIRSIISEDCTENLPRRLKGDPAKEKQLIKEILAVYPRKAAAARVLGMSRSTLWRKLKEYRIIYNNVSK